eukprot:7365275-Prymnesium_polylepis.1
MLALFWRTACCSSRASNKSFRLPTCMTIFVAPSGLPRAPSASVASECRSSAMPTAAALHLRPSSGPSMT